MSNHLRETILPNGKKAYCLNKREAAFVYEQVKQYLKHGIELYPGDTVFDVGANIGLFSLMAFEECNHDVRLFSFEPIPTTYQVLNANITQLDSSQLTALNCGLAAEPGNMIFAYYPNLTTLSTAYRDAANEDEMRQQLKHSVLRNLEEVPDSIRDSYLLFRILRWLPLSIRTRVVDWMVNKSFEKVEEVNCQLRTVSDVINEFSITQIDLLKVDAEKSELAILRGISDQDWTKIKQTAMEIHDLDGRLDTIKSLLEKHGLSRIFIEQEPTLQGSNVYSLYAMRNPV